MSTDNAQSEGRPIIEADLGDNGGHVRFHALEEAKKWTEREIENWKVLSSDGTRSPALSYILERQLELPHEINELLHVAKLAQDKELTAAIGSIKEKFEQYADYRSLHSESQIGEQILRMVYNEQPLLALGAMASNLGMPANELLRRWHSSENELGIILSGYVLCHTSNMVRRSDLSEHRRRMDIQLRSLDDIVRQSGNRLDQLNGSTTKQIEKSLQALEKEQADWASFYDTAKDEWETLRSTFEIQLRLEAPAKYWRERANATSTVAKRSFAFFSAIAIAMIATVVIYGPDFLEYLSTPNNVGPFATLAFVSIPALTALWVLKHVARLFVTNIERSADARLRETMTTTFLALTKEGSATADQDERLLVLEALFRPPAPAPSDDGHLGSVAAILSRRSS